MSSAKIVVFSLKEIIRVILFVICGIFILVLLTFLFMPHSEETSTTEGSYQTGVMYKDGQYVSEIDIDKGQSFVQVSINDNNITDVQIVDQDDMATSFYPLLNPVCQEMNTNLLTENSIQIETDYNNQFTTYVLTNAINEALETAVKN